SIQRRWSFSPIHDINSGNMTFNFDGSATKDSLHGTTTAGSMITAQFNALNFTLTTVGKTIWYHWFGPLLVYMARCPGSSCGGFDGKEAIGSRSHGTDLLPRH
ncbi:hypothetical protein BGZ57DRAFT_756150, partial [Hyaloscypha finlandica]